MAEIQEAIVRIKIDISQAEKASQQLKYNIQSIEKESKNLSKSFDIKDQVENGTAALKEATIATIEFGKTTFNVTRSLLRAYADLQNTLNNLTVVYSLLGGNKVILGLTYSYVRSQFFDVLVAPIEEISKVVANASLNIAKEFKNLGGSVYTSFVQEVIPNFRRIPSILRANQQIINTELSNLIKSQKVQFISEEIITQQLRSITNLFRTNFVPKWINEIKNLNRLTRAEFSLLSDALSEDSLAKSLLSQQRQVSLAFSQIKATLIREIGDERDLLLRFLINLQLFSARLRTLFVANFDAIEGYLRVFPGLTTFNTIFSNINNIFLQNILNFISTGSIQFREALIRVFTFTPTLITSIISDLSGSIFLFFNLLRTTLINQYAQSGMFIGLSYRITTDLQSIFEIISLSFLRLTLLIESSVLRLASLTKNQIGNIFTAAVPTLRDTFSKVLTFINVVLLQLRIQLIQGSIVLENTISSVLLRLINQISSRLSTLLQSRNLSFVQVFFRSLSGAFLAGLQTYLISINQLVITFFTTFRSIIFGEFKAAFINALNFLNTYFISDFKNILSVVNTIILSFQNILLRLGQSLTALNIPINLVGNSLSLVRSLLINFENLIGNISNKINVSLIALNANLTRENLVNVWNQSGAALRRFGDDLLYTINKYTGLVDFVKNTSNVFINTGQNVSNVLSTTFRSTLSILGEVGKNIFTLTGAFLEFSKITSALFSGSLFTEFKQKFAQAISSTIAGGLGLLGLYKINEFKQELISVGDEINRIAIAMSNFVGGLENAQILISKVLQYSAENPLLDSDQLIKATKLLLNYGIAAEELVERTKEVAQVASAVGVSVEDVSRIYGQVVSKGRLQLEELYQFAERGIPIMATFSKMLGASTAEFQQMIKEGKITAEVFKDLFNQLANGAEYYGGVLERQSQTVTGLMQGVRDNLHIIKMSIGAILGDLARPFAEITIQITDFIRGLVLVLKDLYFSLGEGSRRFLGMIGTLMSWGFTLISVYMSISWLVRGLKILISLFPFIFYHIKNIISAFLSLIGVKQLYIVQQVQEIWNNQALGTSYQRILIILRTLIIQYGVLLSTMALIAAAISAIVYIIYKYIEAQKQQVDAIKEFINSSKDLENVKLRYIGLTEAQIDYINQLKESKKAEQLALASKNNLKNSLKLLTKGFEEVVAQSKEAQSQLIKVNAIKINRDLVSFTFNPTVIKSTLDKVLFWVVVVGLTIKNIIMFSFNTIGTIARGTFDSIVNIAQGVVQVIWKVAVAMKEALTGNIAAAKQATKELLDAITNTGTNASNILSAVVKSIVLDFKSIYTNALIDANNMFSEFKVNSQQMDIKPQISLQDLDNLKEKVKEKVEEISEEHIIEISLQLNEQTVQNIKELLDKTFVSLKAFNLISFSTSEEGLSQLTDKAFDFLGIADSIKDKLVIINKQLSEVSEGSDAFQALSNEASNLRRQLNSLKETFGKSFGYVIQSLVKGLENLFQSIQTKMRVIKEVMQRQQEWINYLYNNLLEATTNYYSNLIEKNRDAHRKMLEDIRNFYDELKFLGDQEYQRRKELIEEEYNLKKQQLEQELQDRLAQNEALSLTSYERMVNEAIILQDYHNQLESLEREKEERLKQLRDEIRQQNLKKETEYLNQLAQQHGLFDEEKWRYLSNEEKRKLIEQKLKEDEAKKEQQLQQQKLNEEKRIKKEKATADYMFTLAEFNMNKMLSLMNLRVQLALAMASIAAGIAMAAAQTGIFAFIFIPTLLALGAMVYNNIMRAMGMVAAVPPPPPPRELALQEGGYIDSNQRRETYDNIPARVQAGEFVINREKTKMLYNAIDNIALGNEGSKEKSINIQFAPNSIYIQGVVDDNLINTISVKITDRIRTALI